MLEACEEYFQWVEDNPLKEEKVFHSNGDITRATVAKLRAMTLIGLCRYLGITKETWRTWRNERHDLSGVIEWADGVMYEQKFTGAAADQLNSNIIARDLGLKDNHVLGGDKDNPLRVQSENISADMDPVEAARLYREMVQPSK